MILKTSLFHSANDVDSRHVWVHASTGVDLNWFNPLWTCCGDHVCWDNGNAFMLLLSGGNSVNGAWCDEPLSYSTVFICKAHI